MNLAMCKSHLRHHERAGAWSTCPTASEVLGPIGGARLSGSEAEAAGARYDANFKMDVNGNRSSGLVDVGYSAVNLSCVGSAKSSDCKSRLAVGAKVHVSGTLTLCSPTAATVVATQVKIQK